VTLWAESGGYSVLISDSRESISVERRMVEQLLDRRVEALVVCPVGTESSHLESVHRSGLPIVLADRCFPGTSLIQVTSDHYGGAVDITRLLTAKGHRSIGVLQGLPGTLPNEERLTGIRDAVTEAGFHWDSALVAGNHFTEASGFESAFRLLSDHPEITAIVALSTPNALGAMRAAPRVGRNIPQDLSLVTFDDSPFSDFARVPLTTAAQDVAELGRIAAQSLDCRLQSDAAISQKLCRIKMRLIERNSVVEALS
jgi:LacI family transcriptional regulator